MNKFFLFKGGSKNPPHLSNRHTRAALLHGEERTPLMSSRTRRGVVVWRKVAPRAVILGLESLEFSKKILQRFLTRGSHISLLQIPGSKKFYRFSKEKRRNPKSEDDGGCFFSSPCNNAALHCHPRVGGDPENNEGICDVKMDSRLRGNDKVGVFRGALHILIFCLGGCTLGPDYEKPKTDLPKSWGHNLKSDNGKSLPSPWWQSFHDPHLTALIDEALKANANTMLAMARVAEARALLSLREADLLPELDLNASANRIRNSKEISAPGGLPRTSNTFTLAGLLTYEVDLWGRLARAEESARAQLLSKIYAQEAVRLTVSADVALSYFNLQALEAQRVVLEQTIIAWEASYRLQKTRFEQGLISQLDFLQAESALAGARAQLPGIEQKVIEQINGLSVLLGRSPKELVEKKVAHPPLLQKTPIPSIPLESPTTLFEQRPDIQAAEQDLIASNADIGAIKASYFPTLSLSALLGLQSQDLSRLFKGDPKQWQLTGSLAGPLLDFGRSESAVEAAQQRKEQALITYQQTIRVAFQEVLDALFAQKTSSSRFQAETAHVAALDRTLKLAEQRYNAGYSNYLDVLDAERSLLQSQLDFISARLDQLTAAVTLYKALGGNSMALLHEE